MLSQRTDSLVNATNHKLLSTSTSYSGHPIEFGGQLWRKTWYRLRSRFLATASMFAAQKPCWMRAWGNPWALTCPVQARQCKGSHCNGRWKDTYTRLRTYQAPLHQEGLGFNDLHRFFQEFLLLLLGSEANGRRRLESKRGARRNDRVSKTKHTPQACGSGVTYHFEIVRAWVSLASLTRGRWRKADSRAHSTNFQAVVCKRPRSEGLASPSTSAWLRVLSRPQNKQLQQQAEASVPLAISWSFLGAASKPDRTRCRRRQRRWRANLVWQGGRLRAVVYPPPPPPKKKSRSTQQQPPCVTNDNQIMSVKTRKFPHQSLRLFQSFHGKNHL